MKPTRIRRAGPPRLSATKPLPSRRKTRRKGRQGRVKVILALCVFLPVGILLAAGYLSLHSYVMDLRVQRGSLMARQVLRQTGRTSDEIERYSLAIARNSVEKGLNPAVVAAIVVVESGGNPLVVAPSGDLGLMQVNVRIHAKTFNFQDTNLLNPEENIGTGTSILKIMLLRHGNDKAIAAYNGLLPEKRDYTSRVQAVLGRAGFAPESQRVESNLNLMAAASDWLDALRQATHGR